MVVPAVTLESVFRDHDVERCGLLKIDCEGAEFNILPSLSPATWLRIEQLAMEVHKPRVADGDAQVDRLISLVRTNFPVVHYEAFETGYGAHLFARRRL
jgi:hypothetical protein